VNKNGKERTILMKNFKLIFNTLAREEGGPIVVEHDGDGGPITDQHDGKEVLDDGCGEEASGDLFWGCYPKTNKCDVWGGGDLNVLVCPPGYPGGGGEDQRGWLFMVDENGCSGNGRIDIPLIFEGVGCFSVSWSVIQLDGPEGDYTFEEGDFVPSSGIVEVFPGQNNLISINIKDNFGGPWCDDLGGVNCPENYNETGVLVLNVEELPEGVDWSPRNMASDGPDFWHNKLFMTIDNIDPYFTRPPQPTGPPLGPTKQ